MGEEVCRELLIVSAGCLGVNGAIIEQCGDDAVYLDSKILQSLESETADMTLEEFHLIDLDDAAIGNGPDIKIMISPNDRKQHPIDQ